MKLDPARLQRHLRESLRQSAPATRLGPFTCYLHPVAAYEALNVAVPDEPTEARRVPIQGEEAAGLGAVSDDDPELGLVMLKAHYTAHRRTPRVEFLRECNPELPALLGKHGFIEEARVPVLTCTPESWQQTRHPDGLRLEPLLASSPWETARQYLVVQRDAYGLDATIPERAPPKHWEILGIDAGVLATLEGEPAGAGGLTPLMDGLREVRGLGVRPAYRSKGIGAFLLSALARVAHETGADAAVGMPDSREAIALARKAGYVPAATMLSYRAEGRGPGEG